MYWDWALGTYRPDGLAFFGESCPRERNERERGTNVVRSRSRSPIHVLRWAMELVQWIISLGFLGGSLTYSPGIVFFLWEKPTISWDEADR